jgi:large subunit ribosomal protein L29
MAKKAMTFDAMREWTAEERAAKQKEWTQSLFTLRLQKATGQLENPMKIREVRKDVARLQTAARQAELGASAKPVAKKRATTPASPEPARKTRKK